MTFQSPSHPLRARAMAMLVVALVASCALAAGATSASAATRAADAKQCWKKVLNDWFVDGRIDGTYPPACLKAAMAHLGADAREYSSFSSEAHRALLADERWIHKHPKLKPHYNENPNGGKSGGIYGPSPPNHPPGSGGGSQAISIPGFLNATTPSSATAIPVPLLVLGGLAIALLLAGVASYLVRRFHGGPPRPPMHPATDPPGPQRP